MHTSKKFRDRRSGDPVCWIQGPERRTEETNTMSNVGGSRTREGADLWRKTERFLQRADAAKAYDDTDRERQTQISLLETYWLPPSRQPIGYPAKGILVLDRSFIISHPI